MNTSILTPRKWAMALAAMACTGFFSSVSNAEFVAVGEFNPNNAAFNSFQIDDGLNSGLTSSAFVDAFDLAVESNFANGTSGVIDFEAANGALPSPVDGTFSATFGSGQAINFSGTFDPVFSTPFNRFASGVSGPPSLSNGGGPTLSGGNLLTTAGNTVADISLTGTTDLVTQLGFGVDRVSIAGQDADGFAQVRFTDGSFSNSLNLDVTVPTFSSLDEGAIFVGFTAPVGLGIDQLLLGFGNGGIITGQIDDLAFVTSSVQAVPEPSTMATFAVAAGLIFVRQRRRQKLDQVATA